MEASKRKKIIIITLVVIIVALALFFAFRLTDLGKKPNTTGGGNLPQFKAPSANLEYKEVLPLVTDDQLAAVQLAMNFAERFGTYSSDLPGENIKQLLSLCTKKMSSYLQSMEIDYQAEQFKGVTTKSISYEIKDFASSQAEIIVDTQRVESKSITGKLVSETLYKSIKINLVKSEKQWLVDAAYWE